MIKTIELLSPARNLETGLEAINCGADAVYIGVHGFGARSAAGNSVEDIAQLVNHAHLYRAQVYVTLNTILYEEELKIVETLIHTLYEIGVDAIIIQDLGILQMNLPPIAIHASTQAHNYEVERIQLLENLGINRVVLARELSLQQIQAIRKQTQVELECFVHGALCVALSGQCYMSHHTHQRSANRGECAQLCRLPYNVEDNKGAILLRNQHVLSLKDMNRVNHLQQLVDAGVCSLKIEGRLKDITYVKNITTEYHKRLVDLCADHPHYQRSSYGKVENGIQSNPYKSFNRGYTDYFLSSEPRNITAFDTPKSRGEWVGKVLRVEGTKLYLKTEVSIHNGDGLCFFESNQKLNGIRVNSVSGDCINMHQRQDIPVGTDIFRNKDHQFSLQLEKVHSTRTLPLSLDIFTQHGSISFKITSEHAEVFTQSFEVGVDAPNDPPDFQQKFKAQLSKTGGTPFTFIKINFKGEPLPFMPMGQVNQLRRDLLEQFTAFLLSSYQRPAPFVLHESFNLKQKEIDYSYNVSNSLAEKMYRKLGVETIQPAFEIKPDVSTQALMTTKHCLRFELDDCPKQKKKGKGLNYPLFLTQQNTRYRLEFDCKACEMHIYEAKFI